MMDKLTEVIDLLNELNDWQLPTHYYITENFTKNGKREYELTNLTLIKDATCDEYVIVGNDLGNKLECDFSRVLNGFMLKSLLDIVVGDKYIKLTLKDGYIAIKY